MRTKLLIPEALENNHGEQAVFRKRIEAVAREILRPRTPSCPGNDVSAAPSRDSAVKKVYVRNT